MNDLVKNLLTYIATPLLLLLAGTYLGGEVWAKGKVVLSDILSFFGWIHKLFRKKSVSSEFEGTINGIIKDYNKNFEKPVLPNCKIEWVTPENQSSLIKENVAIICLSFDKRDHNLNFYNATLNFVQTALIYKAKNYLNHSARKAIDLLVTHIILRTNRKEVLSTFSKKFAEHDQDTRKEFESLVPTNDRGLFLNLLIPEFHFYGEIINDLPPTDEFSIEANKFLEWFKELATRDFDEFTNLKYTGKNFKVGVILVAKSETWNYYGPSAYIKWADYYASEGYNSVYVLAKGEEGSNRATKVVNILTNANGFEKTNRNTKIKCYTPEGNSYYVTCFALRPNRAAIEYFAWEQIKKYHTSKQELPAIIDQVDQDGVRVNIFGIKFILYNEDLSLIKITDARKIFQIEAELYLNILDFNYETLEISLSNKGTKSDPQKFVEKVLSNKNKVLSTQIQSIKEDTRGLQQALRTYCNELKAIIFIPKNKATKSRFLDLKNKFKAGQTLYVQIESYDPNLGTFVGSIDGLNDPWKSDIIKELTLGKQIEVTVKEINEFYLTCEIDEGLECRISRSEISWNKNEGKTSKYKVDDKVSGKIIFVDEIKKLIYLSIKKLTKSPEVLFYESNKGKLIVTQIIEVIDSGLVIKYDETLDTGFIPWFEIGWGNIGRLNQLFKPDEKLDTLVFDFDDEKNKPCLSLKRIHTHQFTEYLSSINIKDIVTGKVVNYFDGSVQIELSNHEFVAQAYIHKASVSNITRIENPDLLPYFPLNQVFSFHILDIDRNRKTISLTRLEFLYPIEEIHFGTAYSVKISKEKLDRYYFYSNRIEGWIEKPRHQINIGSESEVYLVSHSSGEFAVSNS